LDEEIEGVKNALLEHLGTYDPDDKTVFQLTTFKDNYSIREPTTDLNEITNQVSSLYAAGGGDCEEASVEALDAIIEGLAENARVLIATDAAPHVGLNLEPVISELRAKGIRVDVVLSGDCDKFYCGNQKNDNYLSKEIEEIPDNTESSYNAVEAFTLIASETGGIFAFRPDVNSRDPVEWERYKFTIFNIVQGGLTNSLVLTEPYFGYQNSTMNLSITGSKTNFQSSTQIQYDEPNIVVNSVDIISPINLAVNITIPNSASIGFTSIQAITDF